MVYRWRVYVMAQTFDFSTTWVSDVIRHSRYANDYILRPVPDSKKPVRFYSQACFDYVEAQAQPHQAIPVMSQEHVTLAEASDHLGIDAKMIRETVKDHPHLGKLLIRRLPGVNKPATVIERATLEKLERLLPDYAPFGWISLSDAVRLTGWHHRVVKRFFIETQTPQRKYRSPHSGAVSTYYQRTTFPARPLAVPPAGDWLTKTAIHKRLRRSLEWVEAKLDATCAEDRLTDNGVSRPHYPPAEYRRLQVLSDATPRRYRSR
jgi:hypothetical protein